MNRIIKKISLIILCLLLLTSCKKEEGSGGNSSLFGKVLVRDYNATFTVLQEEYYGAERDVYLIYGDDKTYSDHTKTNYDGTYEFKYLRPGDYHVYVYSKDSTLQTNALLPVLRNVTINKKHQEVEVPLMIVFE